MREELRADLIRDEGRVKQAYQDTEGFWTIGVGHLIDGRKGGGLPDPIIDALLDSDIERVEGQLDKEYPWWRTRTDGAQRALANMAFQLGIGGVSKFNKMLACLQAGDYAGAKNHALDSIWAQQTPNRAKAVTDLFTAAEVTS